MQGIAEVSSGSGRNDAGYLPVYAVSTIPMAGLGGYVLVVNCRNSPAAVATTEAAVAPATATATPAAPAMATATAAPVATAPMAPATAAVIAASWLKRRTEPWRRQKSRKERRKDRPYRNRNW